MRLFISADIEGVGGVSAAEQAGPQGFEYAAARALMTNEVLAVIEGARAAGVTECVVCDSHGNGLSILADRMPTGSWLVRSWPRPLLMMQGIEQGDYVGVVLLGYHAGADDPAGTMAHTLSSRGIAGLRINGEVADEATISAATAGHFGLPVLLATGDDIFIASARQRRLAVEYVTTKQSCGFFSAMAPSPADVCAQLRQAATRAVERHADGGLTRLDGPLAVEVRLTDRLAAEVLSFLPMFHRSGPTTIGFDVPDTLALNRVLAFLLFCKSV